MAKAKSSKKVASKQTAVKKTKPAVNKKVSAKKTSAPKTAAKKKAAVKKSKPAASKKLSAQKSVVKKTNLKIKATAKTATTTTKAKTAVKYSAAVTPLDDRVLVKVIAKATRTPGGLYIPESVVENDNLEGVVIAVGRGHQDKKGRMHPMEVKIGQKILFAKYSGNALKVNDQDLVFIRENEILGLID